MKKLYIWLVGLLLLAFAIAANAQDYRGGTEPESADTEMISLQRINSILYTLAPVGLSYFEEGTEPQSGDTPRRSLQKINKILKDGGLGGAPSGTLVGPLTADYVPYASTTTNLAATTLKRVGTNGFALWNNETWLYKPSNQSIGLGEEALGSNTEKATNGSLLIGIGKRALQSSTSMTRGIAIGSSALQLATTGSENIAIGTSAGNPITTNSGNLFLGHFSWSGRRGDSNLVIGNYSTATANGVTNGISIGHGVTLTNSNEIVIGNEAQTKFIVPISSYTGAGTKALMDDGTYQTVTTGSAIWTDSSGTLTATSTGADGTTAFEADTSINRTSGNLWEWRNNNVIKASINYEGDFTISELKLDAASTYSLQVTDGSKYLASISPVAAGRLLRDGGAGAAPSWSGEWIIEADGDFSSGSSDNAIVMSSGDTLISPAIADGSTPYVMDTSLTHSSGNLLTVANNGTNRMELDYKGQLSLYALPDDTGGGIYAQDKDGSNFSEFIWNYWGISIGGTYEVLLDPFQINGGTLFRFGSDAAIGSGNIMEVKNNGTSYFEVDFDGVTLGNGGTSIKKVLSATGTLNFGSISAQAEEDLTITVTGAAAGDVVAIGTPTASITTGVAFTAWVSADNTVTVRASNYSASSRDPASGVFRAMVTKF